MKLKRPGAAILVAAASLRLFAAFTSLGFDHPNEPFRLLEPLAQLQGWAAIPPWEWTRGLLSELLVRAHLPIVKLLLALGLSPAGQVTGLKVLYALLSLLVVVASGKLAAAIARPDLARRAELAAMAIAAFWPELIYQSVRLMDYSLEAVLLAASWMLLLRGSAPAPNGAQVRVGSANLLFGCSGFLLGLALFVRPQSGLHLIPLLVAAWAFSGAKKAPTLICLGYAVSVALGGTLELLLTSRPDAFFLQPLWNYLHFNAVEGGAARDYGIAPAYRYFTDVAKYFGWWGLVAALYALNSALPDHKPSLKSRQTKCVLTLLFAFAFPILVHSFIAHKEARFLFGSLWLLIPVATAMGFETTNRTAARTSRRLSPRNFSIFLIIVLLVGAVTSTVRVSHRWLNRDADVRQFSNVSTGLPPTALEIHVNTDPVTFPAGFLFQRPGILCYPDPSRPLFPCPTTPSGLPLVTVDRGPQGWERSRKNSLSR